jgi:hypothetical protein
MSISRKIAFSFVSTAALSFGSYFLFDSDGAAESSSSSSGTSLTATNSRAALHSLLGVSSQSSVRADGTVPDASLEDFEEKHADEHASVDVNESFSLFTAIEGSPQSSSLVAANDNTPSPVNFSAPTGIAIDASGNLFVTDAARHIVRKITPGLVVSTWAGSSGSAGNQNGTGTGALFRAPKGIALDAESNLLIADSGNGLLRKVTTSSGVVSTVAAVAGDSVSVASGGDVYVGDSAANVVRKVTSAASVTGFAGVTTRNSGTARIDAYVVSGDIDPINPAYRTWYNRDYSWFENGRVVTDQTIGLAPVAITEGKYGVCLELTDDTPITVAYTPGDFISPEFWWSHQLPYTKTYGTKWVFPLMPPISGTWPMGTLIQGTYDSQLWYAGFFYGKQGPNSARIDAFGITPEDRGGTLIRIYRLTFETANTGVYTHEVGLYTSDSGQIFQQGSSRLTTILASTTGRFVINRIAEIVPDPTPGARIFTGFWVE